MKKVQPLFESICHAGVLGPRISEGDVFIYPWMTRGAEEPANERKSTHGVLELPKRHVFAWLDVQEYVQIDVHRNGAR